MEAYKSASKAKLRFQTSRGVLSVEQLWDLSLEDLDSLAVSLEAAHKESGKKSFLNKTSVKDKMAKLAFDVALDILNSKVEDNEAALEAIETKQFNEKILNLIAEKQDDNLRGLSIAQLKAKLKK